MRATALWFQSRRATRRVEQTDWCCWLALDTKAAAAVAAFARSLLQLVTDCPVCWSRVMDVTMGRCRKIVLGVIILSLMANSILGRSTADEMPENSDYLENRKGCSRAEGSEVPAGRVDSTKQLADLRRVMAQTNNILRLPVDAYIITSNDEHQSEYLAARDRRHAYATGFTGSNGVAVVTATRAALWTDGRYELQADDQLDCQWELMTHQNIAEWLARQLHERENARVGADPRLLSHHAWDTLQQQLVAYGIQLVEVTRNLVDIIWTSGRPPYNKYPAFVHNESFSGEEWTKKVQEVRKVLISIKADAMVVTSLEEVAWLFNIRGYDIQYTPVLRAYAIVDLKNIYLFTHKSKLSQEIEEHLRIRKCFHELCVRVEPYQYILENITSLSQYWAKVLLPAPCVYDQGVSQAVYTAVPPEKRHSQISPILLFKARKNSVEAHGMKMAHIRDAAAFCDFMAYLERKMRGGVMWTEMDIATHIDRFRGEQRLSKGPSFATIVGYGPNSALPHYAPTNATNIIIGNESTLVLDSGGQYLDGTTDVTRTLHFGSPTDFQKEVYTRVLMGSIQLATLVFPTSVKMADIDVLARGPLWKAGLDYDHGTGHGIGSFLGVHESPINIMYHSGNYTFQKGYFFSDEPGYYEEGNFGVRLENILEVVERSTKYNPGAIFYGFEPVTLIPYEIKLINVALLSKAHRDWLNDYNVKIRIKVGEELKRQRRMNGFHWMMSKTRYIPEYRSCCSDLMRTISVFRIVFLFFLTSYACI